jgi:glycosyltransferase involved in cell wall biosynthesis
MSTTPFESRKLFSNGADTQVATTLPNRERSSPDKMSVDSQRFNVASTWTAPSLSLSDRIAGLDQLIRHEQNRRPLRVMILGIRGFPNVQGGAEKHAEKLAYSLSEFGCDIEAIVRNDYVPKGTTQWHKIKIVRLWNSKTKGVETFVHTFCGVLYAAWKRPDILHIHGIGPAIFTPIARMLGLRVVVTYHSLNYEHAKWGRFARKLLRLGEWAGIKFSNGQITVSDTLASLMNGRYGANVVPIPNGLDKPTIIEANHLLDTFGLLPKRYALIVARIDEAKRQLDLIDAYSRINSPRFKLALVGDADHFGPYARAVAEAAENTPGVVMLGRQTGDALAELYTHAGVFVLPSSHEGQPIAVLEAASYGLSAILSDIPAHREIGLAETRYFEVGDVASLARHLVDFFAESTLRRLPATDQARLIASHDWNDIARRTLEIYCSAIFKRDICKVNAKRSRS